MVQELQHCKPLNLPEMPINEGFTVVTTYRAIVSKVINTVIKPRYNCNATILDSECSESCSKNAFATEANISRELFDVGETLVYSKEGFTSLVKVKSLHLDSSNVLRISVEMQDGKCVETTREHLRSPNNPDIGWIPTSLPTYESAAKHLSEEDIKKITSPTHLSPLQQEFLSLHHRLLHLPFTIMLRMAQLGILPKRFTKLRNDLPPCTSCLFGQSHRRPWRHTSSALKTGGVLRGKNVTQPGQTVGTDQLVSAQPGLVPQEKGTMTRARIWGATIFVDYATKWVKVCLMEDASGDSTLEAKESFEHACSCRGVDPKHYHADNGRFAENTFTEDCKSKAQKITFCGVGAHHQNGVSENTIKHLTLSARTLLLHAQRHWPEYVTTMLWPFALLAAAD